MIGICQLITHIHLRASKISRRSSDVPALGIGYVNLNNGFLIRTSMYFDRTILFGHAFTGYIICAQLIKTSHQTCFHRKLLVILYRDLISHQCLLV